MSIHYTELGSGPLPVVFLHGLFGQGKNWHNVAKSVADLATSRLLDMPDHGRTSWTVAFDYDEYAEFITDWLKDNFDLPVVLVGHSMGGKVAMRIAVQEPELVRGLMVVDISPARNDSALGFTSLVAGLKSLDLERLASRSDADRKLADRIPNSTVRSFLLQNLQRSGDAWHWLANLDMLGDNLHAISGWAPLGGQYPGPAIWVVGGLSDYVRPEHHQAMRELFPSVFVVTLKRAGHWVHSDDPEAFVKTLRVFLTGL
ncbi:alpha/beta fold hydrolase [Tessaracoccus sp. OH4464_COT-324]|uniref:alpha/beta fold hydrolase n=1 Tax=Tessaracoccus sp. OH4464_COT-324 TaxID=2491059 RepID=UPI000F642A9A|nr:alpha/beta fold hydrolase [Tessaracoccus sp. OH4464_COT-324]RRD47895.1 alpha/beta fold hydrolase [Tessaracoccus sp. OH4464_COT-324]